MHNTSGHRITLTGWTLLACDETGVTRWTDPRTYCCSVVILSAGIRRSYHSLTERILRGDQVGFLSRLLIPRTVRRAAHPGRAVKRAVTPKAVRRARRAMSPLDNMKYGVERSIATSLRSGRKKGGRAPAYRHGSCPVDHRTQDAAARCRNP